MLLAGIHSGQTSELSNISHCTKAGIGRRLLTTDAAPVGANKTE
jgi:hypothetical protein